MFPPNLAPVPEPVHPRARARRKEVPAAGIVATLMHTPLLHALVDRRTCLLRYLIPGTDRQITRTVGYAVRADGSLVVRIDGTGTQRWWRAFATQYPVQVYRRGCWYHGHGRALTHGQYGWRHAYSAYAGRYPRVVLDDADIFVVLTLAPDTSERPRLPAQSVVSP